MYAYRKVSFVMFWKMLEEVNRDNELQHRVSEEFHSLVTATEVKKYRRCQKRTLIAMVQITRLHCKKKKNEYSPLIKVITRMLAVTLP